jgi:hypothetical protein
VRISNPVLAARFLFASELWVRQGKNFAAGPTFVRAIRQWMAGCITIDRGARKKKCSPDERSDIRER